MALSKKSHFNRKIQQDLLILWLLLLKSHLKTMRSKVYGTLFEIKVVLDLKMYLNVFYFYYKLNADRWTTNLLELACFSES